MIRHALSQLPDRERGLVISAVPCIILLLAYLLLIAPLREQQDQLVRQVELQQQTLAWMKAARGQMKALRSQIPMVSESNGEFPQRIQAILSQERLTAQRVQPRSDEQLAVWLNAVSYESSIRLLGRLDQEGFTVDEAKISPGNLAGRFNIYLSISQM